jgi:hypothetical protein
MFNIKKEMNNPQEEKMTCRVLMIKEPLSLFLKTMVTTMKVLFPEDYLQWKRVDVFAKSRLL